MSEKHHIDQLFQQELSQKRVAPQVASWEKLAKAMGSEKKIGTHYPLYYRALKVAAIILFVLLPQALFWNYDAVTFENTAAISALKNSEGVQNDYKVESGLAQNKLAEQTSDNTAVALEQISQKKATLASVNHNETKQEVISTTIAATPVKSKNQLVLIPAKQLDFAMLPTATINYNIAEVPAKKASPNDIKVVINLIELKSVSNEEEDALKSTLGKFWKKLKELPIGESD